MARYVDADKLLKKTKTIELPDPNGGEYRIDVISTYEVENAPTEDVVPRSEVEKLQKKFNDYERVVGKLSFTVDGVATLLIDENVEYIDKRVAEGLKNMAVKQAKQEVAREILEEKIKQIEEAMDFVKDNYAESENVYWKARFVGLNQARFILIDAKKKHIGE